MKTFRNQNDQMTISLEREALDFTDAAFTDPADQIFVLDTNALIQIFQFDRESFEIFETHVKGANYFSTRQVEIEFLRNKDYTSNYLLVELAKKMSTEFETRVSGQLTGFLRNFSHILSNDRDITKKIKRYATSTRTILGEVQKTATEFTDVKAKEVVGRCLTLISDHIDFSIRLNDDDYSVLATEYSELVDRNKTLRGNKVDFESEYRSYVFPGMGEKKAINPEGDYFIFHELVKLANDRKKNIVFLTNDTTKSDWIDSKTGKNYEHYQSVFYALSKQALRIENFSSFLNSEPPRDFRRPFQLSPAATAEPSFCS